MSVLRFEPPVHITWSQDEETEKARRQKKRGDRKRNRKYVTGFYRRLVNLAGQRNFKRKKQMKKEGKERQKQKRKK